MEMTEELKQLLAQLQSQTAGAAGGVSTEEQRLKDELASWLASQQETQTQGVQSQQALLDEMAARQRAAATGATSAEHQAFDWYKTDLNKQGQAGMRDIEASMANRGFGDSTLAQSEQTNFALGLQSQAQKYAADLAQREAERTLGLEQNIGTQNLALLQSALSQKNALQQTAANRQFGISDWGAEQRIGLGAEQRGLTKDLYTNAWNEALTKAGWNQQEKMQLGQQKFTASQASFDRSNQALQNKWNREAQAEENRLTREFQQAMADKDWERSSALARQLAQKQKENEQGNTQGAGLGMALGGIGGFLIGGPAGAYIGATAGEKIGRSF